MANFLKIGGYPVEYDPIKHGPYDPARYYGKREFITCNIFSLIQLIILYNNPFFLQPILRSWI